MMDSKFENIDSFTEMLYLVSYRLLSHLVRQTQGESKRIEYVPKDNSFRPVIYDAKNLAYPLTTKEQ